MSAELSVQSADGVTPAGVNRSSIPLSRVRIGAITRLMPSRALIVASALAALTGFSACNRPDWTTPVKAYLSFANALKKGEAKVAWGALSERSKQRLTERSKVIAAVSDGGMSPKPELLLFAGGGTAQEMSEVKLIREEGKDAVLSVVPVEGPAVEVRMVRESDGWKLDVSEMLKD